MRIPDDKIKDYFYSLAPLAITGDGHAAEKSAQKSPVQAREILACNERYEVAVNHPHPVTRSRVRRFPFDPVTIDRTGKGRAFVSTHFRRY